MNTSKNEKKWSTDHIYHIYITFLDARASLEEGMSGYIAFCSSNYIL